MLDYSDMNQTNINLPMGYNDKTQIKTFKMEYKDI